MKKTTAKKLAADYESKGISDREAKSLLVNAAKSVLDAIPRQAAAIQAIGDALTLYAETDAARFKADEEYAKANPDDTLAQKREFFNDIKTAALDAFNTIMEKGNYKPSAEDKKAAEKSKKIAAKRHALVKAQWDKTEKPKHTDTECEYMACVCPLFLAEGNRAFLQAQGLPTAFGRMGLAGDPSVYEVSS